jgi:hypothetical protein
MTSNVRERMVVSLDEISLEEMMFAEVDLTAVRWGEKRLRGDLDHQKSNKKHQHLS